MVASVTDRKKRTQLGSFVLEAHMVMFISSLYQGLKELFVLCEKVFVYMCELALFGQFHGLFMNSFYWGASAAGWEDVRRFTQVRFCVHFF